MSAESSTSTSTFYKARGLFYTGLFFDFFLRDSSNVPEEYRRYQLPAQVGSFAPILGEVQSANKAVELYFDFDFYQGSMSQGDSSNVSKEDLSTASSSGIAEG